MTAASSAAAATVFDAVLPLDPFRDTVRGAFVALDVQTPDPDGFRGAIAGQAVGDVHVMSVGGGAHSVHRTETLISSAAQHFYKFTLVEQGTGMIIQDGRESALTAGDMTFYDTDRPYSLLCDDDTRISVVMFPKDLIAVPSEALSRITATRLATDSPVGTIVRPFVTSLVGQMRDLDAYSARRLSRGAIDVVSTLLEASAGAGPTASPQALRLQKVLDFIDEHLDDPELAPPMIAAAHFVSVRHLHALFKEQGTTVSTVIRNRRLERCYDQLIDPRHAHRSVLAIAMEHGFVDAAHFSRTFRAHYGVPPSALRPGA